MIKILLIALVFLAGCKEHTTQGEMPFIDMNQTTMKLQEQIDLCSKSPDSIFCTTTKTVGDIQPSKAYALKILKKMNGNFTYKNNAEWIYNDTVYKDLEGDCEDIASTMVQHMIDEGIDTKYLSLAYRLTSETTAHLFLAVETSDGGLLHLDYADSGYAIEPQINFYMKMNNAGVNKWIKGNIKEETI